MQSGHILFNKEMRILRKSLFVKYFTLYSITIVLSLLLLSSSILVLSTYFFENDQYQEMEQDVQKLSYVITGNYQPLDTDFIFFNEDHSINDKAQEFITLMANNIEARIYLSDSSGNIFYTSQNEYEISLEQNMVPPEVIEQISQEGSFRATGLLSNLYNDQAYTVGLPFTLDSETSGNIFIACSAQSLQTYQTRMIQIVIISCLIILILSCIIVFIFTANIVKPLKQMAVIAKQYGRGDFSQKLEVKGKNEIMQLAQAMNVMGNDLAFIEQSRHNFIANISHELKTPMTSISGFIDGILDGTIPQNKQEHYLAIVSEEIKRLSRLVHTMLNLSKYETGDLTMQVVPCNLMQCLAQVLVSFENAINRKEIKIKDLEQTDIWVYADQDLIHQVLFNLVENAIKFTNEGGVISFSWTKESTESTLNIRNTGNGLSQEEMDKIFDRFYKTDTSRGLDISGVGLGLNIVKTIVHLHNGNIAVHSKQGKYTEFSVTFPSSAPPKK